MNIYIKNIRDALIKCMPRYWYKAYLYFESTENGSMTTAYFYVKTPAGSIINYGDLLFNGSTKVVNNINAGIDEILDNVCLLRTETEEQWNWGTMYISHDDYIPHYEFHNDPVTDEYWQQNRYKWMYENFGVLEDEDEFEPDVYKKMLEGPRGILLLEDMESSTMAKNYRAIDEAFRLENSTLEDELKTYYDAIAQHIYKLTPLHWGHARLYFKSHENISTVNLSIFKDKEDTCIAQYGVDSDEEPTVVANVIYDLQNTITEMGEVFTFYGEKPFSGLVYTLTYRGEMSLELSYPH